MGEGKDLNWTHACDNKISLPEMYEVYSYIYTLPLLVFISDVQIMTDGRTKGCSRDVKNIIIKFVSECPSVQIVYCYFCRL